MLSVRLAIVAFLCVAGGAAAEDGGSAEDVRSLLQKEANNLATKGFISTSSEFIESIAWGKMHRIELALEHNATYAIAAACNKKYCAHVEMALFDSSNTLLFRSPEYDSVAIFSGVPADTGTYALELSVPGCKQKQCLAGALLLRLAAPRAPINAAAESADAISAIKQHPNFNLTGGDLRQAQADSETLCESACKADAQCLAYSFDRWEQRCYLKAAVIELALDARSTAGIRSMIATPPRSGAAVTIERYSNKAFPYGGQESFSSKSMTDCEGHCAATSTCIAYTYFEKKQLCRPMESTGKYVTDNEANSGAKHQAVGR